MKNLEKKEIYETSRLQKYLNVLQQPIVDIAAALYVVCKYLLARQPVFPTYSSLHPWQITTQIKLLLSQLKEFFSKKVLLTRLN